MSEGKPTPRPWYIKDDPYRHIRSDVGCVWADDYKPDRNGNFIIRAVNCHDELLAACKLALGRIESDIESTGRTVIEGEALRVAIARAESR